MNIYPSSDVRKRFEEVKPGIQWEDVPEDIKPGLFQKVQSAIDDRRDKIKSINTAVSAIVLSTLACRILPEQIPVLPTPGDQTTIYILGGVAVMGILNRANIIGKEEIQISREYNGMLHRNSIPDNEA